MAITATLRHSNIDSANKNNPAQYITSSFTTTAGKSIIVYIGNGSNAGTPGTVTLTKTGVSFSSIRTNGQSERRLSAFLGEVSSTNTGTMTIDIASAANQCHDHVVELDGHDTVGTVVQNQTNQGTGTSLTVTLDNSPNSANAILGGFYVNESPATDILPGAGFVELVETEDSTPQSTVMSEVDTTAGGTAVSASWVQSTAAIGIAMELKALAAAASRPFRRSVPRFFPRMR